MTWYNSYLLWLKVSSEQFLLFLWCVCFVLFYKLQGFTLELTQGANYVWALCIWWLWYTDIESKSGSSGRWEATRTTLFTVDRASYSPLLLSTVGLICSLERVCRSSFINAGSVCRKFDHSRDELTLGSVQWKCTSIESLRNFYSGCQLALLFSAELAYFCNICFSWDAHICMDFGQNNSRACNLFYACQAFWGDRQTITGVSTGTLLTELFRF